MQQRPQYQKNSRKNRGQGKFYDNDEVTAGQAERQFGVKFGGQMPSFTNSNPVKQDSLKEEEIKQERNDYAGGNYSYGANPSHRQVTYNRGGGGGPRDSHAAGGRGEADSVQTQGQGEQKSSAGDLSRGDNQRSDYHKGDRNYNNRRGGRDRQGDYERGDDDYQEGRGQGRGRGRNRGNKQYKPKDESGNQE